jgi:hypothetical protein
MPGLRTRYPCSKCLRQKRCEWLLRDLRNAIADARLRGMSAEEIPGGLRRLRGPLLPGVAGQAHGVLERAAAHRSLVL